MLGELRFIKIDTPVVVDQHNDGELFEIAVAIHIEPMVLVHDG
jgi:hypothetical protein